jgi:hypothetical protein
MNTTKPRLDDETYKEARKEWQQVCSDQTKFLDQANLTLAGGALGLSLTFLKDFDASPSTSDLLFWGGGGLVTSIVLTLASIYASQWAIGWYLRNLDAAAQDNFSAKSTEFLNKRFLNSAARWTFWLNVLASLTLIAGISLIALFAYSNLTTSIGG